MKTHKIKLLLNFCDDVLSGDKRFEDGVHKCKQELLEILRENDCYISTAVINKLLTIGK